MKKEIKTKTFLEYVAPSIKDARLRLDRETHQVSYTLDERYKGMGNDKKYLLKTYGCQANLSDSEKISGILEFLGFEETFEEEDADLIIFNTCAIRENAEDRVFGELGRISQLKYKNSDLVVVVCGCMPQEEKTVSLLKQKYKQVDLVIGTHNFYKIGEYLKKIYETSQRITLVYSKEGEVVEMPFSKRVSNVKAWVDIMYGCDEFCTYCIVPYTRGKERSRLPESIIKEVKELISLGYKEITLLGQNVNAYGKDLNINYFFSDLLNDLGKLDIKRIRFTTSHPKDFDHATSLAMANNKNIMPHLHLPVQSGSNKILKKMNRKYTKEEYLEKISFLKSQVKDVSLTTDIIVAFPTESEEDFEETLDLVRKADFEGAYTFVYSKREGTPAAKMVDDLEEEVKKNRLYKLNELINEGFAKGNKRFEGEVVEVLVDGKSEKKDSLLMGYTKHNKLVNFEGDESLIGELVNIKITKAFTWHLFGEVLENSK